MQGNGKAGQGCMLVGSHARRLRCYQARLAELAGDIGGSHGDSAALEGRLTALEERVADLNTTVVGFELSLNALRESMASREWVEGLVKSQGMTRGGAANSSRPASLLPVSPYSAARPSPPFPHDSCTCPGAGRCGHQAGRCRQ